MNMTDPKEQCCFIFQALADRTRLAILELLKKKELNVTEIVEQFAISQPSISHHLDILKRAGLVTSEKRGREVYYQYNKDAIIECCGVQLGTLDIVIKKR